ncbi:MAG: transposase [Gammaproteobacteria bacterium]|nr:transposase [Gammaproteobacteria bacterium]
MARLPRYILPGLPHHLIQRGNNRGVIFFADLDYRFYLECVHLASERHHVAIHAYVLMTNHAHLVVTPERGQSLSKMMHLIGLRYAQYINLNYQRTGTLWEGRYKATPIDTEPYLLTCYRYVESNPIRANMVGDPGDYRWSSYAHHALGRCNPLIRDHDLYLALGKTTEARCRVYRALFRNSLSIETTNAIRDATNGGWALGNDRFREEIEQAAKRRTSRLSRGGQREGAGRHKASRSAGVRSD